MDLKASLLKLAGDVDDAMSDMGMDYDERRKLWFSRIAHTPLSSLTPEDRERVTHELWRIARPLARRCHSGLEIDDTGTYLYESDEHCDPIRQYKVDVTTKNTPREILEALKDGTHWFEYDGGKYDTVNVEERRREKLEFERKFEEEWKERKRREQAYWDFVRKNKRHPEPNEEY